MSTDKVYFVSAETPKKIESYDHATQTRTALAEVESAVTTLTSVGERVVVASSDSLALVDLGSKHVSMITTEPQLPKVGFLFPSDQSSLVFFTSADSLYKIELH